ncbi:MAG: Ig domain-containing protein [Planctomycetota bacterium]|jgi:hypothetical protein
MRIAIAVGLTCCLASKSAAAVVGEPKKPYEDLPDDKPRRHVELIEESPAEYEIEFRGTVDGTMTRTPVGYAAFTQGWQPNRSVAIENVGTTDVENPRIVAGGKRSWHSLEEVVAEATRGYTAPDDRARAIWEYQRRQRFHACTWDAECNDALKVLNIYGYTLCGNEAHVINDLWKTAGFRTRRGRPIGHVVCEVFYDGRFHLMDSDEHVICLQRDNRTIASCAEVVRDHDLVKRTHTYGIGRREDRKTDEFSASLYVYEGERGGDFGDNTRHSMDLVLRPGESIELRWDHVGKEYSGGASPEEGQRLRDGLGSLARWGSTAYDNLRNGKLRYRPDLSSSTAERGIDAAENVGFDTASETIRPASPNDPATITWRFASPYVFVGGRAAAAVRLAENASAEWRYSTDRQTWQTLVSTSGSDWRAPVLEASLDEVVSPRRRPTYQFWMQLVLGGDVVVRDLAFDHDVQTSLLSLPELEVGSNRIRYTDAGADGRRVRVTHEWLERTAWRPPEAPSEAITPKDGATVSGSRVAFRWGPAVDPDGDRVVDYHFELSEHADVRWPLSPNFERLTSLTPSKGKPQWTVPHVGLLNPQTTYYWRVRARDAAGVWGPWSPTFQFRVEAPGVPLDVKLAAEGDRGFTLHWRPNPAGEPPVAYKVYGSEEKGFTASDAEYLVFRGKGFVRTIEQSESKPADAPDAGLVKTPANLIARVEAASLPVVGPGLTLPNTNKAFYRVVAVDAAGNESGPSDYAEVPRPFVVVEPERKTKAGKPYRHQPVVIRSIGDLRCRRSDKSSYNAAFWDREEHTFRPVAVPPGLSIDAPSGTISGTPEKTGAFDVTFEVADQLGKRSTASYRLIVED